MGTSSRIGIRKGNKIHSVRVNYDGYLEGVGECLLNHYNTEEKADELIKGGEIRSLQSDYVEYYEYDKDKENESDIRYYIDELTETADGNFIAEAFIKHVHKSGCEYYYLMDNGKWFCGDAYGTETPISHKLVLLSDAFEIMKK